VTDDLLASLIVCAGIATAFALVPVSRVIVDWTWDAIAAFRKFRGTV
jgi:hypothetical protein